MIKRKKKNTGLYSLSFVRYCPEPCWDSPALNPLPHAALQPWTRIMSQNKSFSSQWHCGTSNRKWLRTVVLLPDRRSQQQDSICHGSHMRLGSKNPHTITQFSLQPYLCAQLTDEETKTQMKGSAGVIASVAAE